MFCVEMNHLCLGKCTLNKAEEGSSPGKKCGYVKGGDRRGEEGRGGEGRDKERQELAKA